MRIFGPFIGPDGFGGRDIAYMVFWFVVVAAIVVGVLLIARSARRPGPWFGVTPGAPWQHSPHQALAELDLRYARGEVDRADYLQRRADLLGMPTPGGPAPAAPAPSSTPTPSGPKPGTG